MTNPPSAFTVKCVEDWEEDGIPKLTAYWDGYRAWTIGFGHTGSEVVKGYTITREQADQLLGEDLQNSCNNVDAVVRVPINDKMRTVLVSFDFNEGDGALDGSTLLKVLNSGDYKGVVDELARWVYARDASNKMRYSAGLANRRAKEAAVWGQGLAEMSGGQAPTPAPAPQAQPSAPAPIQPAIPDAAPTPPPPVRQDPDNHPQPPLWNSTTIISAIGTILGAGGASWLSAINNPYAMGALAVVAVLGFIIIRERVKTRRIGGA